MPMRPTEKILIICSHPQQIALELTRLIQPVTHYEVKMSDWNQSSNQDSPRLILPVLPTSSKENIGHLLSLIDQYRNTVIIPVLDQRRFSHTDVLQITRGGFPDFITYPLRTLDAISRIKRLLEQPDISEIERTKQHLSEKRTLKKIVGESRAIKAVVEKIPIVARSGVDVLIQGETGTGKEIVARSLHYLSSRSAGPFIAVNCASLPPTLFENELFGHFREAFTDAKSRRPGLVQEAEGGTIFLDEVDALDPTCQAKLLRFIEEREYRPLGSRKPLQANLNMTAATNNDLWHNVETGRFREDLFYRINVITLTLPPLRERREDIPLLVRHFLKKYEKRYGIKQISPDVLASLSTHEWPGNIRQLENLVQQLMILTPSPVIDREHLPSDNGFTPTTESNLNFQEAKKRVIEEFEKNYIIRMLRMHQGNITHTAKAAGKDRRVFARMIKKYRISADAFKSPS